MEQNIQKYQAFLKVIESGSFTKAAIELNYSQPGISRMIHDLEKDWKVVLFDRGKNNVSLTAEGKSLLPHLQKICDGYQQLLAKIDSLNNLQTGILHIGILDTISKHWLPPILKRFMHHYPDIKFKFISGSYDRLSQELKTGSLDCAFLKAPVCKAFDTIFLKSDPLYAILPSNHPLAKKSVLSLKQLEDIPFLILDSLKSTLLDIFSENKIHINISVCTPDDYSIMSMVESGLGISILPALSLERLPYRITAKELSPALRRELILAINHKKGLSNAMKYFFDFLQYPNYDGYCNCGVPIRQIYKNAPERIVAKAESTIDNLLFLGLEDKIAGICETSEVSHPPYDSQYAKLHRVNKDPSVLTKEEVLSVHPDIIIGWGSLFDSDTLGSVQDWHKQGIHTYIMKNTAPTNHIGCRKVKYFIEDLKQLARIFEIEKESASKIKELEKRLEKLELTVKQFPEKRRPKILTIQYVYENEFFGRTAKDLTADIIRLSGGISLDSSSTPNSWLPLSRLKKYKPDIFLIINSAKSPAQTKIEDLLSNPGLKEIPAIKNKSFLIINQDAFYCGSERTLTAIEQFQPFIKKYIEQKHI